MKANYDFSKGKRGRVLAEPAAEPGKVRITIRVDEDLVEYFGNPADRSSGKAGYQTLINAALREYVGGKSPKWEETLRRIIREEMDRGHVAMHVSKIDFPAFYGDALGHESGDFVSCLEKLNGNTFPGKRAMHQAARLVWLADRLNEQFAKNRDALQILFYVMAAETVAKLVRGIKSKDQSKKHVRLFFEEDCSDRAREQLAKAFTRNSVQLSAREAVDFLYSVRCDVVHEGRYFDYSLSSGIAMLNADRNGSVIANIGQEDLRRIVLEGALLAAHRRLPDKSKCETSLRL